MADFKIVCNNTADLPDDVIRELEVTVMPLAVNIGDEIYKHIPMEDFYQKLRAGAMPTTSAANIGEANEIFEPILASGCDLLYLAFSSGLSTTYETLYMAAGELRERFPERKIYVVDTMAASSGEGLLVIKAAEMRRDGKSIDEVRDWVESNKLNVAHWFTVGDLGHLKRGGRVSAATAAVGGMLNIKPILIVDNEGRLTKADSVRGRRQSLLFLAGMLEDSIIEPEGQIAYIPHGDCVEDANWLKEQIVNMGVVKDVVVHYLGPVIASHTGAGMIGLVFLGRDRGASKPGA